MDLPREVAQAGTVTITDVPAGAASVTVSSFLEALQPGEGALPLCPTLEDVGQACGEPGTLTFTSDVTGVTVVAGATAEVEPEVYSVPFVLREFAEIGECDPPNEDLRPAPGTATDSPLIRFVVVDARSGTCNPQFFITQDKAKNEADLAAFPCSDSGEIPCSKGGSLGVDGLQVCGETSDTVMGPATVNITACNFEGRAIGGGDGNCAELPGFEYSFTVLSTPTDTPLPTDTPTLLPTDTPPPPSTATPTPNPFPI